MRRDREFERDDRDRHEALRRSSLKQSLLAALACVLLAVVSGVGYLVYRFSSSETMAIVTEKYRPRFAEQRTKLKRIAEKLPPVGTVQGDAMKAKLNPRPEYDVRRKIFNTAILMASQCADPDREMQKPSEFNLGFHEDEFLTLLQWTGDKSPLAESARKAPAKDLAEKFERSLGLAYLVVARPVRFDPPRAQGGEAFTGGDLELEVFLVDLKTEDVLGMFRRSFRPDDQVMVTFRKDRKEGETAEAFVYSNVWAKARTEVAATLAKTTGGTLVIDRD